MFINPFKDLIMLAFIDFFYQNWFIKECARKKKAKIPEFYSFLWVKEKLTFLINSIKFVAICVFES